MAEVYQRARRDYPRELLDHLADTGLLRRDMTVLDLGAGTGQLAKLAATVANRVIAMDPEPDMVRVGQQATAGLGIQWVTGGDADVASAVPTPIDLVVIANAFHHMSRERLLTDLDSSIGPAGAVVICSSSIPVWLQTVDWSVALRAALGDELGRPIGSSGVPDHASDLSLLRASPFGDVGEWVYERTEQRSIEDAVGEIVSSSSGAIDSSAAARLLDVLKPFAVDGAVTETVRTTALTARRPADPTADSASRRGPASSPR